MKRKFYRIAIKSFDIQNKKRHAQNASINCNFQNQNGYEYSVLTFFEASPTHAQ